MKRDDDINAELLANGIEAVRARDAKATLVHSPHRAAPNVVPYASRGSAAKPKPSWRDHIYTADALQSMTFPPISFCVPGLIPEGLTLVAGRPKLGKSWMALDICLAVAGDRLCLGERKPAQGAVLYAAMEDNQRRIQRRIDKLLKTFGAKWPEQLTFAHAWRRLDKGGVEDLAEWIKQTPKSRLIVLDTLAGVKPIKTQQGYTEDHESLAALQRLASDAGVSIIVLHHVRKMEAEDPIDTVSGTLGLTGCADSVLVLNRTSKGTTLYVRGRDVEEAEHAIIFDKHSCKWTILGAAADVHRSNERGRILKALEEAIEPMTPQEIVAATGLQRNNVDQLLHKMAGDGEVRKLERGQYLHPDRPTPTPDKIDKKIRKR